MNLTDAPGYTPVPFANAGTKNAIPTPSQITIKPGAASFTDGFPPVTFQPLGSGGVPPFGADFNGILYDLSSAQRWQQAGGVYGFDPTFASGIGGYPKGAMLKRADNLGYWLNTADANSANPDTGGAGWIAVRANAGSTSIAMAAGNNTPTAAQLAAQTLLLTGAPATAATLVLPLTAGGQWIVSNTTTGAGAVNVQGATGSGVAVQQGAALMVYTDGTNFYAVAAPISGAYLPIGGTAVAATKLATPRNFNLTGPVTWAAQAFDGTGDVTFASAIAAGALSISMTSGLQGALNALAPLSGATFTGAVTTSGYLLVQGNSSNSIYLGLNNSVTSGRNWAICSSGGGPGPVGDFVIYDSTAGQNRLQIDANGLMTVGGSIAAANFSGNSSGSNTGDQNLAPYALLSGATFTGSVIGQSTTGFGLKSITSGSNAGLPIIDTGSFGANLNLQGNGATTPNKTIRAQGGNLEFVNSAYSAVIATLTDAGAFVATSTVRGGSDERVKDNVVPIIDALDKVRVGLVGMEYDRNDDNGRHEAGFIAQRVREHLPHLVGIGNLNGIEDFHSMDYMHAVPYATAAIVELHDLVLEQAKLIAEMRRELALLRRGL